MEALKEIFLRLAGLSHVELMLGLLFTGTLILVLEDWRLNLWALMAQYVLVGLLLVGVIPLSVALIKIVVGGLVCVILFLTAQHVHWGRRRAAQDTSPVRTLSSRQIMSASVWYRLAVALLAAAIAYALGTRHPFVEQTEGISQASYWLLVVGLLTAVMSRRAFRAGLGLFTFQSGFGILLATFEKGLSVAALVGMVNFLTALAIAYLTAPWVVFSTEDEEA
ncbi:MAG TPA: hypothetical protein ENO24_09650 [Chloroflexi bacterium]|nr:hypothetical protein [Chloroflexota bacterium]